MRASSQVSVGKLSPDPDYIWRLPTNGKWESDHGSSGAMTASRDSEPGHSLEHHASHCESSSTEGEDVTGSKYAAEGILPVARWQWFTFDDPEGATPVEESFGSKQQRGAQSFVVERVRDVEQSLIATQRASKNAGADRAV